MKKKTMSKREQDERLGELFKQTALGADLDALMAELVPTDNPWWVSEDSVLDTDDPNAGSSGVVQFRQLRVSPKESSESAPGEKHVWQEFRAAAASVGEEKPRALPEITGRKRLLGETEGAKGKCSFYAVGDAAFVAFGNGVSPQRISLRGHASKMYPLSSQADADGHYEIVGIKAPEVAQFLALRRKPRW